jgi:uncharacterized protein YecT (DUF1311 family)
MDKKKRDLIREIQEVKSRSEFDSRYDFVSRLENIERALEEFMSYQGDYNMELLKYIPIATVACYEAFFRSTIKEMVDFGKPYSDRVAHYNQSKNVKLDFEVISAIQTKTLTVGDFVSHILPYNNLSDVVSNISVLIDKDFMEELKMFAPPVLFEDDQRKREEFRANFGDIVQSVESTYRLRHIFCHEFATVQDVDAQTIKADYSNCRVFLEQANDCVWNILYPNAPLTQSDMNDEAHEEFEQVNKKLWKLVKLLKTMSDSGEMYSINPALFDKSLEKWMEYRDAYAAQQASSVKGGSMYSMIYAGSLTRCTKEKIESLKTEFDILLRKNKVDI